LRVNTRSTEFQVNADTSSGAEHSCAHGWFDRGDDGARAVLAADDEPATLNDTSVADLGTLSLRDVRTGQNDMVLDNLGDVATWTALAPLTSNGPSGIGFVNFGSIDRLDVRAPIRTFGNGARGFDLYDGSLRHASFAGIATHGDGAIGIQVSRPLPVLEVAGGLTTAGGRGRSLVKGVQVDLRAIALSVKEGGEVGAIAVGGQVRTTGDDVISVEIEGAVGRIDVAGGVVATGERSDAVHVRGEVPGLGELEVRAARGRAIVRAS
jgi:hypothetical protein